MSAVPVRPFRMFLARILGGPQVLVQITGRSVEVDLDDVSVQVAYRASRRSLWATYDVEVVTIEQVTE